MTRDIRRPLSIFFVGWIVLGNLLWWFGPAMISHTIGDGLVWSIIIPLSCLAMINPRRAAGVMAIVLGGFAMLALALLDQQRRKSQQRRFSQAIPS